MVLPPQESGSSGGNHGSAPAGGGGKPPGKRPNGGGLPNKGGTDKPDVPYSEEEEEEGDESNLFTENIEAGKRSYASYLKYAQSDRGKEVKKAQRESPAFKEAARRRAKEYRDFLRENENPEQKRKRLDKANKRYRNRQLKKK